MLVWIGKGENSPASSVQSLESTKVQGSESKVQSQQDQPPAPSTQPPSSYTPPHLAERIRAEQSALEARGATDGERKTITALFADLKGSTALIEGLDPEEARAIIDPALQLMMDAVHRYEGYVAQALGDGIFALFGAPIAHEDHPQRALYAALRMQEEMRRYGDTLGQKAIPPCHARGGKHRGSGDALDSQRRPAYGLCPGRPFHEFRRADGTNGYAGLDSRHRRTRINSRRLLRVQSPRRPRSKGSKNRSLCTKC